MFAIAQDSAGFLWFGTRDGLNKYDGSRFVVYRSGTAPESVAGSDVRALYTDPLDGKLWVGTRSGLSKYDAATDKFTSFRHEDGNAESLTSNDIKSIYRDQSGRLWVGTSSGLNLLREDTNTFTGFNLGGSRTNGLANPIEFITETAKGELLIGTNRGLFQLGAAAGAKEVGAAELNFTEVPLLRGLYLTCSLEDQKGNLWLGTRNDGVLYWDPTESTLIRYRNEEDNPGSLSGNSIRDVSMTEDGDLWVGTFNGLNLLKAGQTNFLRYVKTDTGNGDLMDNSIRTLLTDRAGSLWIGTYYGGVHHLDDGYNHFSNFRNRTYENSISTNVVSSFAEEPGGRLWIGTEGGGLNFFDPSTNLFGRYQAEEIPGTPYIGTNIKELVLENDELWIGTFQSGISRLHLPTGEIRRYEHDPQDATSLANNNVYNLHREGDLMWVITYGSGLDILHLPTGTFRHFPHDPEIPGSLNDDLARSILRTRDGTIWIGTEKGLNRAVVNGRGLPQRFEHFFQNKSIYWLHQGQGTTIWLGTFSSGLIAFDYATGATRQYTTADGLPDNSIFAILESDDGAMWLSTGNGLTRFDPLQESFTNYDASNGLENLEYNFNAAYRLRTGELLFGGINGFTSFNPDNIRPSRFVPPIVFTHLDHNNLPVGIGDEDGLLTTELDKMRRLTFKYNEANFTIGFAALDYFSPENNQYAYLLEGVDRDWNYTSGQGEATYTLQREGLYKFRLRGANSDGIWSETIREIDIRVLPPAWRTWWAYLLYFTLAGLTVFALVHFLRLRHKVQLQEVAKRQQDELMEMKLRFFTNITHEFRTPLTLIIGPLRQLLSRKTHDEDTGRQLSLINKHSERLLNLVNQVLTFRKLATDHEEIEPVEYELPAFLSSVFESFAETARLRRIDYQLNVTEVSALAWFDADKMEKVVYNLLSNAFKFTPEGGRITVSLSAKKDRYLIKVRDSGVGIDPAIQEDIFKRFYEKSTGQQSAIKSSGIGLAISRQMVELHHGRIYVAEKGMGADAGAEFVVELLKGKTHFKGIPLGREVRPDFTRQLHLPQAVVPEDTVVREPEPIPTELPGQALTLLIVDDNEEIRTYVQNIFKDSYRVITASTGVEGLERVRSDKPDLVVSDVMMPEMDGLTFCHHVKTDLAISHIPIILLTARTAEPLRLEGLRTGADDYLTKPFHPEELQLRVRNILQSKQRAKQKFARSLSLDPAEVTVTNADEMFLESALATVEEHMGDEHFKVDQFAAALAVSRSLLFTKLKALTGQTPNNFIKTLRLKRAAQLLETGQVNVSEVAYQTGFRDPKYFRRLFKAHFNELPSRFGKEEE